jgi:sphinganine-1-phosphate aldolase
VKLIHAPVDPVTGMVNLKAVASYITKNTIMLIGSTPSYPHGIMDDIPALSKLAIKHKIGI